MARPVEMAPQPGPTPTPKPKPKTGGLSTWQEHDTVPQEFTPKPAAPNATVADLNFFTRPDTTQQLLAMAGAQPEPFNPSAVPNARAELEQALTPVTTEQPEAGLTGARASVNLPAQQEGSRQ